MKLSCSCRVLLSIFYCLLSQRVGATSEIAHSNVRAIGIVAKDPQGRKINLNIKNKHASDTDPDKKINEAIKQRCTRRLQVLMGDVDDKLAIKREILLCQYQEIHLQLKKDQQEYERRLRQGEAINIQNPYLQEFGNRTVNPHDFHFIHLPKPCSRRHTILVSVHSAAQNFAKRAVLRNTWANPLVFKNFLPKGQKTKLVFILGIPQNELNQTLINFESEKYEDIVQVNFLDHYYNNTYKAIYHMKWVSSYQGCPKVNIVIKTDDDIMFNLRKFPGFWKNFTSMVDYRLFPESMLIAGNQFAGGPPRDPDNKWYIPRDVYKYDTFPPWFQGMVYLLTPGLAARIYQLSFTTPYIFTDDVYIGIVADRVPRISRWNLNYYYNFVYDPLDKKLLSWRFEPIVFYHNPSVTEMYNLWFFYCSYITC